MRVSVAYALIANHLLILASIGGRYTPFMTNYRPQIYLRTADITTALAWPEGTADAEEKMASSALRSAVRC